jgi:hypothetical protein
MAITIETISQKIELTGVGDIVVTQIEQDQDVGDFVREIRFYSGRAGEGLEIFMLRLRSADRATLQISSPAAEF